MDKVLILASVASMIDQFNIPNIELLKNMGYEVHVACNFKKGNSCPVDKVNELTMKLNELNVKYFQIDFDRNVFNVIQNIKAYKQTYILLKKNRYKFIHCHSPIGGVCGRIAAHRTKTKVIYTAHGFHFYKGAPLLYWLLFYPIEKWLSKYTDILITINREDESRAKEKFNARNVYYLPGIGISVERYRNKCFDKIYKRKELGLSENDFVILSVGELNKNKNHEIIIKALYKIKEKNIHYMICGKGPLERRFIKLINKYNLNDNVHLMGFRTDIDEIYKISDLFVFPSFREGLSVALMEALASGLPVIASNIRGNNDLIEHGKNGILIDDNKIDSYVNAILQIYNKTISLQCFDNYEIYDLYNIMKIMKKIYSEILQY